LGKGSKNGRRLALKVGCNFKNLKHLSKPYVHLKSSCLRIPWNLNKSSSLVMEGKRLSFYNKELKDPSVSYYKNNHIM